MVKKRYLDRHPSLKLIIDRYEFFTEKKILRLVDESARMTHSLLTQMKVEAATGGELAEEAMQAREYAEKLKLTPNYLMDW